MDWTRAAKKRLADPEDDAVPGTMERRLGCVRPPVRATAALAGFHPDKATGRSVLRRPR